MPLAHYLPSLKVSRCLAHTTKGKIQFTRKSIPSSGKINQLWISSVTATLSWEGARDRSKKPTLCRSKKPPRSKSRVVNARPNQMRREKCVTPKLKAFFHDSSADRDELYVRKAPKVTLFARWRGWFNRLRLVPLFWFIRATKVELAKKNWCASVRLLAVLGFSICSTLGRLWGFNLIQARHRGMQSIFHIFALWWAQRKYILSGINLSW